MKGERGVVHFTFNGTPVTITEPTDVILSDNEASKELIERRYGYFLAHVPENRRS
jgi:hypothetical protein